MMSLYLTGGRRADRADRADQLSSLSKEVSIYIYMCLSVCVIPIFCSFHRALSDSPMLVMAAEILQGRRTLSVILLVASLVMKPTRLRLNGVTMMKVCGECLFSPLVYPASSAMYRVAGEGEEFKPAIQVSIRSKENAIVVAPPQPNHPTLRRPSPPCVILRHSAPAPSTLRHLARVTAPHHLALAALPHPAPNRRMRRPSRMSRSLWLLPKPQAMPITCRPIHLNRRCTSAFLPLVTSSPRDCARLQPSPWPAFCVHSYRRANSARAGPFVRHSPARKGGRRCCGSKPGFLSRAEFASCGTCRADNPPGVWLR